MILILKAIFLGAVQGMTEFLPVSSSGHLVIFHDILNFDLKQNLAFDVALHLGTLLALVIYFRNDLKQYFLMMVDLFRPGKKVNEEDVKTVLYLIYATVPAVILGLIFERAIEMHLHSTWVVFASLIVGSGILWLAEKYYHGKNQISDLNLGRALLLGLAQALALIPGLSRSGMTIAAGMGLNLNREQAAKFSFLLGIPIIFGAGFFKLFKLNNSEIVAADWWMFGIGFVVSAAVGFTVINFLLKYLREHTLNAFIVYRLFLATAVLIYILMT